MSDLPSIWAVALVFHDQWTASGKIGRHGSLALRLVEVELNGVSDMLTVQHRMVANHASSKTDINGGVVTLGGAQN